MKNCLSFGHIGNRITDLVFNWRGLWWLAATKRPCSHRFDIRIPRILNALLVGAALAAAGAGLQALFENPLADPSLIGTSGGAALGVICVLAFGSLGIGVPLAAFVGALVVCLVILFAHHVFGAVRWVC